MTLRGKGILKRAPNIKTHFIIDNLSPFDVESLPNFKFIFVGWIGRVLLDC